MAVHYMPIILYLIFAHVTSIKIIFDYIQIKNDGSSTFMILRFYQSNDKNYLFILSARRLGSTHSF